MVATQTAKQAERQQAGQQALATLVPVAVAQAWPLVDVHDLSRTLPGFVQAVQAIVQRFGPMSAVAAIDHYRAQRAAVGVSGAAPVRMPTDPAQAAVDEAVRGAVSVLYGPVDAEVERAALDAVSGEAEKLVLDYGRRATQDAVQRDREAKGWARVPHEGACAFCLMLATFGVLYKSARSAGRRSATAKWADAKGYINVFHPNCRCTVEPVFGVYEKTAVTRQAEALWAESTKGLYGADALKAFRRAVEGRTDGATRSQKRGPKTVVPSRIRRRRTGL